MTLSARRETVYLYFPRFLKKVASQRLLLLGLLEGPSPKIFEVASSKTPSGSSDDR